MPDVANINATDPGVVEKRMVDQVCEATREATLNDARQFCRMRQSHRVPLPIDCARSAILCWHRSASFREVRSFMKQADAATTVEVVAGAVREGLPAEANGTLEDQAGTAGGLALSPAYPNSSMTGANRPSAASLCASVRLNMFTPSALRPTNR